MKMEHGETQKINWSFIIHNKLEITDEFYTQTSKEHHVSKILIIVEQLLLSF